MRRFSVWVPPFFPHRCCPRRGSRSHVTGLTLSRHHRIERAASAARALFLLVRVRGVRLVQFLPASPTGLVGTTSPVQSGGYRGGGPGGTHGGVFHLAGGRRNGVLGQALGVDLLDGLAARAAPQHGVQHCRR